MAKAAAPKKTVKKPKPASAPKAETNLIRRITSKAKNAQIDPFKSGDTVNVFVKVKEGEKERVQLYKGIVTKIQGSGIAKSFTVRKISSGVGVERIFPFSSPAIDRVELVSIGKVRRSRLYYLRDREGKSAKINSEMYTASAEDRAAAAAAAVTAAE